MNNARGLNVFDGLISLFVAIDFYKRRGEEDGAE